MAVALRSISAPPDNFHRNAPGMETLLTFVHFAGEFFSQILARVGVLMGSVSVTCERLSPGPELKRASYYSSSFRVLPDHPIIQF